MTGSDLPDRHSYDEASQELEIGGGRFGPITREVFDYEVGGRNVIKSWVDYRSREPAGKRTSPLDDVNPLVWEHEWSKDLVELLTALSRLVELEPAQADLLGQVAAGPLITTSELASWGVRWAAEGKPGKPRYPAAGGLLGEPEPDVT